MVEFETIKSEEVKFGRNSFIEIALKKAKTEDGENVFVSLSKGFYMPESNQKRFRKSFSLPKDPPVIEEIAEKLKLVVQGLPAESEAASDNSDSSDNAEE